MLLLIMATMTMGWIAEDAAVSPDKIRLFVWHKSLGISVLLFWFIRLGWWLASAARPDFPGQPGWLLLTLIGLHVSAALWHRFRQGDSTLSRMWFGSGK